METQTAPSRLLEGSFDAHGVPIRYIEQGQGPAIILLHGGFRYADRWIDYGFFGGLFEGYRLIAMDQRGHGKSGKPRDPSAYGLEMVRDVVRLLDHLRIDKAHLIGHSMGAEIALKTVSLFPQRFHSAVLAGSGWSDDSVYELIRRLARSLERGEGVGPSSNGGRLRAGPPPTKRSKRWTSCCSRGTTCRPWRPFSRALTIRGACA